MLCVGAEDALAAAAAAAAASDKMRSVTLGGTIQRAVRRMAGGRRRPGAASADSGTGDASASASASCSGDDTSIASAKREGARRCIMQRYRSQLEQEVKKLQRQLQEEIDLHLALADAITYNAALILKSSIKLPDKAHELLISISSLEIAITKLEEDLNHLHYQLCHARNERLLAENKPGFLLPTASDCQASTVCDSTGEEPEQMLRELRFKDYQCKEDFSTEPEDQQDDEKDAEDGERVSLNMLLEKHQDVSLTGLLEHQDEEMQEACSTEKEGKEDQKIDALPFSQPNLKKSNMSGNLWNNPNQLSEEMNVCLVQH